MTRRPSARPLTLAPSARTVPAISSPGEKGNGGFSWYLPAIIRVSAKFTPAAATWISTWSGAGAGTGTSSTVSAPGPPQARQSTAFMARSEGDRRGRPDLSDAAPGAVQDRGHEEAAEPRGLLVGQDAEAREQAAHEHLGGAPGAVVHLQRDPQ